VGSDLIERSQEVPPWIGRLDGPGQKSKQEELIAAVRYAGLLDYALVADAALFIESDAEGRAGCESTTC